MLYGSSKQNSINNCDKHSFDIKNLLLKLKMGTLAAYSVIVLPGNKTESSSFSSTSLRKFSLTSHSKSNPKMKIKNQFQILPFKYGYKRNTVKLRQCPHLFVTSPPEYKSRHLLILFLKISPLSISPWNFNVHFSLS